MNASLEFHDSRVDTIVGSGDCVRIAFDPAYVHRSNGQPGIDAGDGYLQSMEVVLLGASWTQPASNYTGMVSEGTLLIDGVEHALVPISLQASGRISLQLIFVSGQVFSCTASSIRCQTNGEARYVESVPAREPSDYPRELAEQPIRDFRTHLELGYYENFKGAHAVLLVGSPPAIGSLARRLREFAESTELLFEINAKGRVDSNGTVRLFAVRNANHKSESGVGIFYWHCGRAQIDAIESKLLALMGGRSGHHYFELTSKNDATLIVSLGEYRDSCSG